MSEKKNRLQLPKRLLGVKIPKATRKLVKAQFKGLSDDKAEPQIAAAVGTLIAILTAKVEQAQPEMVKSPSVSKKAKRKAVAAVAAVPVVPAVH